MLLVLVRPSVAPGNAAIISRARRHKQVTCLNHNPRLNLVRIFRDAPRPRRRNRDDLRGILSALRAAHPQRKPDPHAQMVRTREPMRISNIILISSFRQADSRQWPSRHSEPRSKCSTESSQLPTDGGAQKWPNQTEHTIRDHGGSYDYES